MTDLLYRITSTRTCPCTPKSDPRACFVTILLAPGSIVRPCTSSYTTLAILLNMACLSPVRGPASTCVRSTGVTMPVRRVVVVSALPPAFTDYTSPGLPNVSHSDSVAIHRDYKPSVVRMHAISKFAPVLKVGSETAILDGRDKVGSAVASIEEKAKKQLSKQRDPDRTFDIQEAKSAVRAWQQPSRSK